MNRDMFSATIRQNVSRVEDGVYYVKLNNRSENKSRTIVPKQHYNVRQPDFDSARDFVIGQIPYDILNNPANKLGEGIIVLRVLEGEANMVDLPGTTKRITNNANMHNKCEVLLHDDDFDFVEEEDYIFVVASSSIANPNGVLGVGGSANNPTKKFKLLSNNVLLELNHLCR